MPIKFKFNRMEYIGWRFKRLGISIVNSVFSPVRKFFSDVAGAPLRFIRGTRVDTTQAKIRALKRSAEAAAQDSASLYKSLPEAERDEWKRLAQKRVAREYTPSPAELRRAIKSNHH